MQKYINVALGVAVVGTTAVNCLYAYVQGVHREADYCKAPVNLLRKETKCVQLLGGAPIKVPRLNLKKLKLKNTEIKLEVPVKGNTRRGTIYTMSTRPDKKSDWNLQYAVFYVKQNTKTWTIWLHPNPADGGDITHIAAGLPVEHPSSHSDENKK